MYLREITPDVGPGSSELSAMLPQGTFTDYALDEKSLRTLKGGGQTSLAGAGAASLDILSDFFTSFSSQTLAAQTIGSGTWTLAIAVKESNIKANSFLAVSIYIYRPSTTSVVGYIYDDTDTFLGNEWTTSESGRAVQMSGGDVVAEDGDILVLEVWRYSSGQDDAVSYTNTIYYDGTTEPADGAAASNAASYLESPADVGFSPRLRRVWVN